jgi:hypothetical protein
LFAIQTEPQQRFQNEQTQENRNRLWILRFSVDFRTIQSVNHS